jgi:putative membrane protein
MNNEQLIRAGHIWAIAVLLACAVIGFASGLDFDAVSSGQENVNASKPKDNNQNKAQNKNSKTESQAQGEQTGSSARAAADDRNFILEAAMGGMMEVELGKIAVQRGASEGVKQFGQRMVDDHSKAGEELAKLAASKGITLPTQLDEKHRNDVDKLSKLSGAEFDRAYAKAMLSDHKKDVSAFEKKSMKSDDADLKAFASKTLPTLKEHLEMAKALNGEASTKSGNLNRP